MRQLCWRDFNHQLLAARPELAHEDLRPRAAGWREDDEGLAAWREGRTGYPLVDAGMRQLLHEGFMHNRARLVTGSFLTKHLGIDWRAAPRTSSSIWSTATSPTTRATGSGSRAPARTRARTGG